MVQIPSDVSLFLCSMIMRKYGTGLHRLHFTFKMSKDRGKVKWGRQEDLGIETTLCLISNMRVSGAVTFSDKSLAVMLHLAVWWQSLLFHALKLVWTGDMVGCLCHRVAELVQTLSYNIIIIITIMIIIIAFKGGIWDFLQSPQSAANCL